MKHGIAYLFLLVYTTVMLKPLVPYISDFVAHAFWKYEHISTVHYEHGQYHTHYESLEAAAKKDPSQKSSPVKNIQSVPDHLIFDEPVILNYQPVVVVHLAGVSLFAKQSFYPPNFRPPKA